MIQFGEINTLVLVAITVAFLLYKFLTRNYDYFKKRGIPYIKPTPPFGNFLPIATFRTTIGEYLADLYKQTKAPFFGIFILNKPHLIIRSPQLIKHMLIKDFSYFTDRNILSSEHDPISSHLLFVSKNPVWKNLRTKLTPIFTSGKLKLMFPLINSCGVEMNEYINKLDKSKSIEAKELCSKYSTDVLTKCAFAINSNSFKTEDAAFRKCGRILFDFNLSNGIQQTSFFFLPTFARLFHMKLLDPKSTKFLSEVFWSAIESRQRSGLKGNDLIDLLIELRKNEDFVKECNFEGDKVVAQAIQFFTAGFETTSSTMAFFLYELCIHPEIQATLREEIKNTLSKDGITYESIHSMKYLDMCFNETLRKYPTLPFLDRICLQDYQIPDSDVIIEKGTPVFIPMFGLHYDEQFFPKPDEFIPERFGPSNDINSNGLTYIPFGDGPRNCIGARFGLTGAKCGVVKILSEYQVARAEDTPVPLVYETKTFILASKVGLPMKFIKSPLI